MDAFLQTLSVGRRSFEDPFFHEGDSSFGLFKRMCVFDVDDEQLCHEISKPFSCEVPGCISFFETLMEFEMHYNTLHRYVCCMCHKTLPSPHFLDLHIEENHDSFFSLQAERKPMYQCLVEDCKTKFRTSGERKDHCLKIHSFPPNFRWLIPTGNPQKAKSKATKSKRKPIKNVDTEMLEEQKLDSAAAESVMETTTYLSTNLSQEKKKNKQKNHGKSERSVQMDVQSGNSCSVNNALKDNSLSEQSDKRNIAKKNPAPFKGFLPRNINANRTFHKKMFYKGQEWHQTASNFVATSSSLESNALSTDLRDSLPSDMDAS